jgi:hypothetical protein
MSRFAGEATPARQKIHERRRKNPAHLKEDGVGKEHELGGEQPMFGFPDLRE